MSFSDKLKSAVSFLCSSLVLLSLTPEAFSQEQKQIPAGTPQQKKTVTPLPETKLLPEQFGIQTVDVSSGGRKGFQADKSAGHFVQPGEVKKEDPITYLANHESYDETGQLVWSGNVRIWQGDQALRADRVTLDRPAGLIRATGHVALLQPDGSTLYAKELEFQNGIKDGIGRALYMRMEENVKLAANGMRQSEGVVQDLRRVSYTPCNTCAKNPHKAPFWQIQASAVRRDENHKRLEFENAWIKVFGLPVLYLPYFKLTDPSVKRQSGFLPFQISPHDRYLGTFFTVPYYWVIDKTSDITLTALFATKSAPNFTANYRKMLNFGSIKIQGGVGVDTHDNTYSYGTDSDQHGAQAYILSSADFVYNKYWHYGAQANLATSANYMRDYRVPGYGTDALESGAFVEGFGQGSQLRFDVEFFQGMNQGTINNDRLAYALPSFAYNYQGQPDKLGGTFSFHTEDFDLYRVDGLRDQRGEWRFQYDRPFDGPWGQKWKVTGRLDSTVYHSVERNCVETYNNNSCPSQYLTPGDQITGQILPTFALQVNWPFMRTFAHGRGYSIFEPIAQFIAAPNTGGQLSRNMPNEDSLYYNFDDSTLFELNRYEGTDRLDGGVRGNIGIHQNWSWKGHVVDILVGESFQDHITHNMIPGTGLNHHLSDPVGRILFAPNNWLSVVARGKYNPWENEFDYGEGLFNFKIPHINLNAGYIYEVNNPYYFYTPYGLNQGQFVNRFNFQHMNQVTASGQFEYGSFHVGAFARFDPTTMQWVSNGGNIGYANECFGLDLFYSKQYTSIGGEARGSTFLVNIFLKSIGTFGAGGSAA
ncbi:LPS-assembly protein LptD [Acetobacteraceae bacterium]|nr:LPS-assembly protein LptD [Acetobacteraceae bacterium]